MSSEIPRPSKRWRILCIPLGKPEKVEEKIICNDDLILSARLIPECVLICHDNLSFLAYPNCDFLICWSFRKKVPKNNKKETTTSPTKKSS